MKHMVWDLNQLLHLAENVVASQAASLYHMHMYTQVGGVCVCVCLYVCTHGMSVCPDNVCVYACVYVFKVRVGWKEERSTEAIYLA